MELNNYFDFAENDFFWFKDTFIRGIRPNSFGAIAQSICERYMKHIIDIVYTASTAEEANNYNHVMRTHNLRSLISFLENNTEFCFSPQTKSELLGINGLYFSTKCPGD